MNEHMTDCVTPEEFELFRDFIEKHCGILLGPDKAYLVEHRLAGLVNRMGCDSYHDLYNLARRERACGPVCSQIIDAITTQETSWFREVRHFNILKDVLLPNLWESVRQGRKRTISIWSAACATGQEPYSIAITAAEFCRTIRHEDGCPQNIQIKASDISETALAMARSGIYDNAAMERGLDESRRRRFFKKEGKLWRIDDDLKSMVEFSRFNLKQAMTGLAVLDVVFLRNVVIYFSEQLKKDLFHRVAERLHPGGWMFLGTGETVVGHTDKFEIIEFEGAVVYRLK